MGILTILILLNYL